MWVADMDFQAPEAVTKAIRGMAEKGIYGYAREDDNYRQAICGWMARRHKWQVQPNALFSVHGIVNAIALSIQAYTKTGDGIIIFSPVYHAFSRVIEASGRACGTGRSGMTSMVNNGTVVGEEGEFDDHTGQEEIVARLFT